MTCLRQHIKVSWRGGIDNCSDCPALRAELGEMALHHFLHSSIEGVPDELDQGAAENQARVVKRGNLFLESGITAWTEN